MPDGFADWTGWTIACAVCFGMLWGFLTGRIIPRSLLDTQVEATRRAQEANDKNLAGLQELREMGHTTIALVESLKATERNKR